MELRLDSRTTQEAIAQARALLPDRRVMLVFEDRLTLSAPGYHRTDPAVAGGGRHHRR